ncbi:MAG: hypothetical protein CMI04_08860 [Oceanospirillaceae bacterium]|nr:hypothetical protein [Oceanospirillaceae bacterium]|tara:strand:+ start:7806 stop:8207 length:402 start_codon:yes stop_codon:yes gene_type:complete
MALTQDRNTPSRAGDLISVPMAAGATIYAGAMVVANASGFAAPGTTATGLTYLGRAESAENNIDGSDGDIVMQVRRGCAFQFKNDGSDPVTQASLGKACYIVDDETVAATNGSSTRSAAGTVIAVGADGVWVE